MKKKSFLFLNSFELKIIAAIFMTLDHIGMFFLSGNSLIIVRSIGRLALPLFIFLSVDGIYHSKNPYKYSLTLIILGFIMDIVLYTISKLFLSQIMIGNVFTLLGLGSLCATLIRRKDYYSLLAVFPFAYATMASFENIFSPYINCEYGFYGITMYLAIFLVYELVPYTLKQLAHKNNVNEDLLIEIYQRRYRNYYSLMILILHGAIFYLFYRINYTLPLIPFSYNIQSWCCLAGIFFIFFNGKKGYEHKFTKYAFYVYYPLHVAILGIIAYLISI